MEFVAYPQTPDFHKFRQSFRRYFNSIEGAEPEGDQGKEGNAEGDVDAQLEDAMQRLQLQEQPRPPLKGTFIGTVKLHGTNISIVFTRSGDDVNEPQLQSRNKIITPQSDNAGAATWLKTTNLTSILKEILRIRGIEIKDFEEVLVVGEWAGMGIQKSVAINAFKPFFAIFNIRIDGHWVDIRRYSSVQRPKERILNIANFEAFEVDINLEDPEDSDRAFNLMKEYTLRVSTTCPVAVQLLAEEGAGTSAPKKKNTRPTLTTGEGIVWTMVPQPENDTVLYNFKTKGEQFLATSRPPTKAKQPASQTKAEEFVDFALGE